MADAIVGRSRRLLVRLHERQHDVAVVFAASCIDKRDDARHNVKVRGLTSTSNVVSAKMSSSVALRLERHRKMSRYREQVQRYLGFSGLHLAGCGGGKLEVGSRTPCAPKSTRTLYLLRSACQVSSFFQPSLLCECGRCGTTFAAVCEPT